MIKWICDGCGKVFTGIIDKDGDFISVTEMHRLHPAVGCNKCGSMNGEVESIIKEEENNDSISN